MTFRAGIAAFLILLLQASTGITFAGEIPETHSYSVSVDWAAARQSVDNFGASDCWSMQKIGAWSDASKNRIADLLFSIDKGIGLSCWRFNLGAGARAEDAASWRRAETFETAEGQYDWTRQANERWFLAAAKARGVSQFVAFVNSPPARMTRNGLTHCSNDSSSTNLKEGYEPQFSKYLSDILVHFRENPDESQRIDFGWISPVNEPNWAWDGDDQEGNRVSNKDIKAIVRALNAELARRGLGTKILMPESGRLYGLYGPKHFVEKYGADYEGYLDEFCGDRDFLAEIGGRLGNTVCSHSYFCDVIPRLLLPERKRLRKKMAEYPEWKYWQTEYCIMQGSEDKGGGGRDLSIDTALEVARVIHYDLTLCNASAWQWWTAVSPEDYKDGLIYTNYRKPGDAETIFPSKTLWALGQFSRFIRPGAKRVELEGADHVRTFVGSAYKSQDGKTLVQVYVNLSPAPAALRIRLKGLPPGTKARNAIPYVTSDVPGVDVCKCTPVLLSDACVIPARSITTLVSAIESQ